MEMKKYIIVILVVLTTILVGCSNRTNAEQELFDLQGTLVGDASSVSRILRELGAAGRFSLSTDESPYGINLDNSSITSDDYLEIAVFLFTLIPNLDWARYQAAPNEIIINRSDVTAFLGRDLDFENEAELRDFIQEHIDTHGVPNFMISEEN